MKRFVTLFIAALLFIMPTFSETWVYKDWENENGYLHNVYVYDTEEDFMNLREWHVQLETECTKHRAETLFSLKKPFQKCIITKDVESLIKIMKKGNYAYGMVAWYEIGSVHAFVFKLVKDTLYYTEYQY